MKMRKWPASEIEELRSCYAQNVGVAEIAERLGRTEGAIRNQAYKLRITTRDDGWSDADTAKLIDAYSGDKAKGELNLQALSDVLGRSKPSICRKARGLGLTDITRRQIAKPKVDRRKFKTDEARSEARSRRMVERHKACGHPMLGRKHTTDALDKMSAAAIRTWEAASEDQKSQWVDKMLRSKLETRGVIANPRPNASWKAGWREIGDKRKYYRSRWEANYARYLQWLKERGQIIDWQHEPETFWFDGIKRGVRSYLPDFRVWENDGTTRLYEVKGWMDARSKTTLKRMAKYYPQETIILVREKEYSAVSKIVRDLIPDWEHSSRKGRV